jgi:hypothetical protein
MVPLQRAARAAVALILLAGVCGEARSQPAYKQPPTTPAEIAEEVARGIDANTLRSPRGAPLEFESAKSRGNVVEMRYIVNDLSSFDRFKGNSDKTGASFVTYWCSDSRIDVLRQGVVINITYARSDNKDRVEFTINKASCIR